MKSIVILSAVLILFTASSCKAEDKKTAVKEESEVIKAEMAVTGKGSMGGGYEETNSSYIYNILIRDGLNNSRKDINFCRIDKDSIDQSDFSAPGILWDRIEADVTNKTISYYKKDGRLVVTFLYLDKDHFRISDFGSWLTNNYKFTNSIKNTEKTLLQTLRYDYEASSRFLGGSFFETNVVYSR